MTSMSEGVMVYSYILLLSNICTLLASIQDHDTTLLIVTCVSMGVYFITIGLKIFWIVRCDTQRRSNDNVPCFGLCTLQFIAFAGIVTYLTMLVRNINTITSSEVKIISTIFLGCSLLVSGIFLYNCTDLTLRKVNKVDPA